MFVNASRAKRGERQAASVKLDRIYMMEYIGYKRKVNYENRNDYKGTTSVSRRFI